MQYIQGILSNQLQIGSLKDKKSAYHSLSNFGNNHYIKTLEMPKNN
jgi:hypothetical protein